MKCQQIQNQYLYICIMYIPSLLGETKDLLSISTDYMYEETRRNRVFPLSYSTATVSDSIILTHSFLLSGTRGLRVSDALHVMTPHAPVEKPLLTANTYTTHTTKRLSEVTSSTYTLNSTTHGVWRGVLEVKYERRKHGSRNRNRHVAAV